MDDDSFAQNIVNNMEPDMFSQDNDDEKPENKD
jgi:hypothetical protein